MKILGIDPGTRIVGYGIVEDQKGTLVAIHYGAIRTKAKNPISLRLRTIYEHLVQVIEQYTPEVAAIEKVFYGKNIQSSIRIGEGRGVALLAVAKANLDIHEYDATKIKKAVCGVGSARKHQVQSMVQTILQLPELPTPSDAADALAIAICHYNNLRFSQWK